MATPSCNCFLLLRHMVCQALLLARAKAGRSKAARMAMMAITTSNSIKVKAFRGDGVEGADITTNPANLKLSLRQYTCPHPPVQLIRVATRAGASAHCGCPGLKGQIQPAAVTGAGYGRSAHRRSACTSPGTSQCRAA